MAEPFKARRVEALRPMIESTFDLLLEKMILDGQPVDLCAKLAEPFAAQVVFDLMHIPDEGRDALTGWSHQLRKDGGRTAAEGARASMRDYLSRLMEDACREGAGLPVSANTSCSPATLAKLFVVDYDTVAARIGYGVLFLLAHPEQLRTLRHDHTMISAAVEEILRLAVPGGSWLPRYALSDFEYAGSRIRAGDLVVLSVQSANRDPRKFSEPDRFDIFRNPNPHVGLGYGKYYCLGSHISRAILKTAILRLFARLPELSLTVPVGRIKMVDDSVTGGLKALPVAWPE
jgi:pentalenolactone synthase